MTLQFIVVLELNGLQIEAQNNHENPHFAAATFTPCADAYAYTGKESTIGSPGSKTVVKNQIGFLLPPGPFRYGELLSVVITLCVRIDACCQSASWRRLT